MAHYQSWIAFLLVLAFGSILAILMIVYTSQTGDALASDDLAGAKNNFQISSGFVYFFAAVSLLGALKWAFASKDLVNAFMDERNARKTAIQRLENDVRLTKGHGSSETENRLLNDLEKLEKFD
jgi:hypothetical protein